MIRSFRFLAPLLAVLCLFGLASARSRHRVHPVPRRIEPKATSVWSSPEACSAALARGERRPRAPGTARIASWNVRWFPDGVPGNPAEPAEKATDIAWLACALAWMDVDVIALQEIKSTPAATNALMALMKNVDRLTGGKLHLEVDHCPGAGRQSVAFLYDERRVTGRGFHDEDALNPTGHACDAQLRPGFAGYFRFKGGADAHLVAVHLKSGPGDRDRELRRKSLAGFGELHRSLQTKELDTDVIALGDFNTMGCDECNPKSDSRGENDEARGQLLSLHPEFRLLETDRSCSQYYRGKGTLLDHVAVSGGAAEVARDVRVVVEGYCAELGCGSMPRRWKPRAFEKLSDHCPILLDFQDRDVD